MTRRETVVQQLNARVPIVALARDSRKFPVPGQVDGAGAARLDSPRSRRQRDLSGLGIDYEHALAPGVDAPQVALRFRDFTRHGKVAKLTLPTLEGNQYFLEYKNDWSEEHWTSLPAVRGYGYGVMRVLNDPDASGPQRFYRVREEPLF